MLLQAQSSEALARIESKLSTCDYFASISNEKERVAMDFVARRGGETAVQQVCVPHLSACLAHTSCIRAKSSWNNWRSGLTRRSTRTYSG